MLEQCKELRKKYTYEAITGGRCFFATSDSVTMFRDVLIVQRNAIVRMERVPFMDQSGLLKM
jgi:hypothetical protein